MMAFSVDDCCSTPGMARPVASDVRTAVPGTACATAGMLASDARMRATALMPLGWPLSSGRTASRIARHVSTFVQRDGWSWYEESVTRPTTVAWTPPTSMVEPTTTPWSVSRVSAATAKFSVGPGSRPSLRVTGVPAEPGSMPNTATLISPAGPCPPVSSTPTGPALSTPGADAKRSTSWISSRDRTSDPSAWSSKANAVALVDRTAPVEP